MNSIYTIGFTQKKARHFFSILQENHIDLVADIRLNNTGQLAGFTRRDDLQYFLEILHMEYVYWEDLAPDKQMLNAYRLDNDWEKYEQNYRDLMSARNSINRIDLSLFQHKKIVLLCSEATATHCHRRIAAEMIAQKLKTGIIHL
jgi:uncharacterized protein (DUF488 family)